MSERSVASEEGAVNERGVARESRGDGDGEEMLRALLSGERGSRWGELRAGRQGLRAGQGGLRRPRTMSAVFFRADTALRRWCRTQVQGEDKQWLVAVRAAKKTGERSGEAQPQTRRDRLQFGCENGQVIWGQCVPPPHTRLPACRLHSSTTLLSGCDVISDSA